MYQVRARHRNEEVREVVPSDYGGVMVTDRGRSYDAQALSGVKQQKCLAHVLRSIMVRWSRPREGEVAASAIV